MSLKPSYTVLNPFGPVIHSALMPYNVVEWINKTADDLMMDGSALVERDWSSYLVGSVTNEYGVSDLVRGQRDVRSFLLRSARAYAADVAATDADYANGSASDGIKMAQMWINDMRSGDFNPVHFHSNCDFSCVGFLRVPEEYENEIACESSRKSKAGYLHFIDGRVAPGSDNLFYVKPVVGNFYIFPSWLLHCVYPFRSSGIRRSFSANFQIKR